MWQLLKIEGFYSYIKKKKHIVREKFCNYLKNVNFNRKIKGLLNRKRKKVPWGEESVGFFSWLEAFYSKTGELDKGWDVLQLYEKSLQSVQSEEEKCSYTGPDLPGVFGGRVWPMYLKHSKGRTGLLMLFIGIGVCIYIYTFGKIK